MRFVLACFTSIGAVALCGLAQAQTFQSRTWHAGTSDAANVDGTYASQTSTTVTLKLANGSSTNLLLTNLDDESLRYLRNVRNVKFPYRTWTRTGRDRDGNVISDTFQAAIFNETGFDSPLSQRHVVMVRADNGQLKGYAYADLDSASQTYVDSVAASFPGYPSPGDGAQFAINTAEAPRDAVYNSHATDHFTFYWGNTVQPDVSNWNDPTFRQMNFDYFERIWNYYKSNNSTLPYWNQSKKYKTSVYITETGLEDYPSGFAFGGETVEISPAAMLAGSSVIPHEFGHTNQYWSGGFQSNDDLAINVGWLWECNANWNANSFVPGLGLALGVYAERSNYELDSSRMNYGSWPWLEIFADHPKFSRSLPIDMFRNAARDSGGNATETPFQTTMRLGVANGAFSGNGIAGFGDVIGEMSAHNATWDYIYGQGYLDQIRYLFNQGIPTRAYTYLQPVPDRANWWRPIYSQAPRQYGNNVIPLKITTGQTISATLSPIVDETLGSNWRATIVALAPNGGTRYSRMWKTGTESFTLQTGEKAFLAIAAAPDVYSRQLFRPGYTAKRRFPYEVTFSNCVPDTTPVGLRTHVGISGHAHPNGGGFVADSASVASTAYVGPNAQVLDAAQVQGSARIEDYAAIGDSAIVSGSAVVGGYAYVRQNATVTGSARVRDYALVQQNATIQGDARVREFINVEGDGAIQDDVMVKGFGDVYTANGKPVGGGTAIGQDSEIYFGDYHAPVNFGTVYGYSNSVFGLPTSTADGATLPTDIRTDNRYLYAHWAFDQPRKQILIDDLLDNDGVLRGGAQFKNANGTNLLDLNGTNSRVTLEGHAFDAAGLTIDLRVYCRSEVPNQTLFAFTGPGGAISFTHRDSNGKAALVLTNGTQTQTFEADRPLPINNWVRVTIALSQGSVKVYLGQAQILSSTAMTLSLDAIGANAGYLGWAPSGVFFNGLLYDMAIYHKAYDGPGAFSPPYTHATPPYIQTPSRPAPRFR